MATNSNDLNMILKAKVVKLKVELDYKNSKLPTQVNEITKFLENKPVKLKVKLEANMKDLQKQISELSTKMSESKSIKPMKIDVQIDIQGSANKIKAQLRDVFKAVKEFNDQYGKQILKMQSIINQAVPGGAGGAGGKNGGAGGSTNTASWAKGLADAKKYLQSQYGNSGLFTAKEFKDADGNVQGFIATLTKANGVVQKIKYQWNTDQSTFTPISRETVTETEKNVHKAHMMLQMLQADIAKLKDGASKTHLENIYKDLEKRVGLRTLNMDNVMDLQRQIKEEGVLQQQVKQANNEYLSQLELIRQIVKARRADIANSGGQNTGKYNTVMASVKADSSQENLKLQAIELRRINDLIEREKKNEQELLRNQRQRLRMEQQLKELKRGAVSNDKTSQQLIQEINLMIKKAKTGREWLEVQNKMNKLGNSNKSNDDAFKSEKIAFDIEQKMLNLVSRGKMTKDKMESVMRGLPAVAQSGLKNLQRVFEYYDQQVKKAVAEAKTSSNRIREIYAGGSSGSNKVRALVDARDINALQKYFGEMYKGKVETVTMREATDSLGRAVTEMKIKMAGTGKQVQTYTLQMEEANGALRETGRGLEYNANRNLGVFEQLRIAMARVPVWMIAMTAFYGTINTVKKMTQEIIQLDTQLTEIRRVASSNISLDVLFGNSVNLAKELGNDTHDVLDTVAEMARTFGDFNERQLLAITRTATLMSNVSDLSAQEAGQNLVGTMNAFNISAEESIHIVDALNEVDNNYAISTKQLAEGMSKSASTASTFGVTMEQLAGHITAIGAVTMENGAIIG